MKNSLIPTFILLLFLNCGLAAQTVKTDYIEFEHLGVEDRPFNTLFIVPSRVNFEIKGNHIFINSKKTKLLTKREKVLFSAGYFTKFKMDDLTFEKISYFIDHFSAYRKDNSDYESTNFAIISNNTYYLSYKQTEPFSSQLLKYLKAENCNRKDVLKLTNFLNTNFY